MSGWCISLPGGIDRLCAWSIERCRALMWGDFTPLRLLLLLLFVTVVWLPRRRRGGGCMLHVWIIPQKGIIPQLLLMLLLLLRVLLLRVLSTGPGACPGASKLWLHLRWKSLDANRVLKLLHVALILLETLVRTGLDLERRCTQCPYRSAVILRPAQRERWADTCCWPFHCAVGVWTPRNRSCSVVVDIH